nr:MAG TPA: hypothetical protein [Caudoviricetes sp.]
MACTAVTVDAFSIFFSGVLSKSMSFVKSGIFKSILFSPFRTVYNFLICVTRR